MSYVTLEELGRIAETELAAVNKKLEQGPLTTKDRMAIPQQDMPVLEPRGRARLMDEVAMGYTSEQAIVEAQRCLQCKNQPCVNGCPVNVPIPQFIAEIAKGDFKKSVDIIKTTNLLPAICGRICNRRCEDACTRGSIDQAIAIDEVKKFIAQQDLNAETRFIPKKVVPSLNGFFPEKVAIIGAGPAGLSAAIINLIASSVVMPIVVLALGIALVVLGKQKHKTAMLIFGVVFAVLGLLGLLQYSGIVKDVPILQVGIPAVLSIYFDVFSSCIQAFIFAMLTMLYIASAATPEES